MTAKSAGFGSRTLSAPAPLKTWAYKAAIRAVLRDGNPEAMDMLFQPMNDIPLDGQGRRIYARRDR